MLRLRQNRKRQRGQALLESALVLLVFIALLVGILDFGQLLFTHQLMVERVRSSVRQNNVQPWDGGQRLRNLVLYNQPTAPVTEGGIQAKTFFGMKPENIKVVYTPPISDDPNEERVTVSIVNYQFRFFSPWIAGAFVNNYAVTETAPMFHKP